MAAETAEVRKDPRCSIRLAVGAVRVKAEVVLGKAPKVVAPKVVA